jgi:hypothetical protein
MSSAKSGTCTSPSSSISSSPKHTAAEQPLKTVNLSASNDGRTNINLQVPRRINAFSLHNEDAEYEAAQQENERASPVDVEPSQINTYQSQTTNENASKVESQYDSLHNNDISDLHAVVENRIHANGGVDYDVDNYDAESGNPAIQDEMELEYCTDSDCSKCCHCDCSCMCPECQMEDMEQYELDVRDGADVHDAVHMDEGTHEDDDDMSSEDEGTNKLASDADYADAEISDADG